MAESPTILLMLSGGIDSTYLLYHYLRDTEHRVHAHHISLRYPHLQRWRVEDPATERIVAWCRTHVRAFEYSTSRFDLDFSRIGWDSDLQLLVAAKVALNLGPEPITVTLGWCADDLEIAAVRSRVEQGVTSGLWRSLCASVGSKANVSEEINMPLIERGLTKAEVIDELPDELLALTWSCRKPVFEAEDARPCGECHACVARLTATGEMVEFP